MALGGHCLWCFHPASSRRSELEVSAQGEDQDCVEQDAASLGCLQPSWVHSSTTSLSLQLQLFAFSLLSAFRSTAGAAADQAHLSSLSGGVCPQEELSAVPSCSPAPPANCCPVEFQSWGAGISSAPAGAALESALACWHHLTRLKFHCWPGKEEYTKGRKSDFSSEARLAFTCRLVWLWGCQSQRGQKAWSSRGKRVPSPGHSCRLTGSPPADILLVSTDLTWGEAKPPG